MSQLVLRLVCLIVFYLKKVLFQLNSLIKSAILLKKCFTDFYFDIFIPCKHNFVDFLWSTTTYSSQNITRPVGGQVRSFFEVSSSWQCVYWFNYLKVMPLFICLSRSLFFFYTISSLSTDPRLSLFLPPRLSVWLSVHPCLPALRSSSVDISHSLAHGLGSVCSLPFCGAQLLCLPGASTGVKPL